MAIMLLAPLPLCLMVPASTLNEVCHREFTTMKLLVHSIFVSTLWFVSLVLIMTGLRRKVTIERDSELPSSPQLVASLRSGSEREVHNQLPASDPRPNQGPGKAKNLMIKARGRHSLAALQATENLHLSAEPDRERRYEEFPLVASEPEVGEAHEMEMLRVCELATACKATFVYTMQMCLSWSVFFHGSAGPAHLQGMLVENFLEHTQGLFLLLLLCGLFETPLGGCFRRLGSCIKGGKLLRTTSAHTASSDVTEADS
jgi:hypothetical protein